MAGRNPVRNTPQHEASITSVAEHQLRQYLKNNYQGEEQGNSEALYLTETDLNQFWNDCADVQQRIVHAVQQRTPNKHQHDLHDRFRAYRRIACVLIRVNYKLLSNLLPQLICRQTGSITDSQLPINREQARLHIGDDYGEDFYSQQFFVLDPVTIGIQHGPAPLSTRAHKLPFVGAVEYERAHEHAGFARVKIRQSCFKPTGRTRVVTAAVSQSDMKNVSDVAYAVLPYSPDSEQVLKNKMERIREIPLGRGIVELIDVLHRDSQLLIFVPFTPLYDLESMLCTKHEGSQSPALTELLKCLAEIADGSAYLLENFSPVEINVTPQDILRYPEQSSKTFGTWKLVNFSFGTTYNTSRSDHASNLALVQHSPQINPHSVSRTIAPFERSLTFEGIHIQNDSRPVLGNVYNYNFGCPSGGSDDTPIQPRPVARNAFLSDPRRIKATRYRPPELEAVVSGTSGETTVVWSIGCVFLELLAWVQGYAHENAHRSCTIDSKVCCLRKLRKLLSFGRSHDKFFALAANSENTHSVSVDFQEDVRFWIREMRKSSNYEPCARLAQGIMQFQPASRPRIRYVGELLLDCAVHVSSPSTSPAAVQVQAISGHGSRTEADNTRTETTLLMEYQEVESIALIPWRDDTGSWQLLVTEQYVLLCKPLTSTKFCIRHVDTSAGSPKLGRFQLLRNHNWHDLEVAGRWGAAISECQEQAAHECLRFLVFDIKRGQQCLVKDNASANSLLRRVVPSSTGLIAFCYDRHVSLQATRGSMQAVLSNSKRDFNVLCVAFSHNSKRLYVNLEDGREHLIDIWDVGTVERPYLVQTVRVNFDGPIRDLRRFRLLPCLKSDACIIFQDTSFCLVKLGRVRPGRGAQFICTKSISLGTRLFDTQACFSAATNEHHLVLIKTNYRIKVFSLGGQTPGGADHMPQLIGCGYLPNHSKQRRWLLLDVKPHPLSNGILAIDVISCYQRGEIFSDRASLLNDASQELTWEPSTPVGADSLPHSTLRFLDRLPRWRSMRG